MVKHIYGAYQTTGGIIIVAIITIAAFFLFMRMPSDKSEKETVPANIAQTENPELFPPLPSDTIATPNAQFLVETTTLDLPLVGATALSCNTVRAGVDNEEENMLSLINNHRSSVGVPALQFAGVLNDAANTLAWDHNKNGYSAHTDSTGGGPQDRLTACGYGEGQYGEITGHNASTQAMFNGWMNSPSHRDNIEFDSFRYVGIAQAPRPGTGSFWTAVFLTTNPGGAVTKDNTPTATPTPTQPPATCDTAAQLQGYSSYQAYCAASNQCPGVPSNNGGQLSCPCVPCQNPTQPAQPTPTTLPGTITPTPSEPSPTPSQGNINFSAFLTGIGNNINLGENNNPNSAKNGVAEFTNLTTNEKTEKSNLTFVYDTAGSYFKSAADFTAQGNYEVRLRLNNTLWQNLGVIQVNESGNITIPTITLITGDTNLDNTLDLLDYNAILSCITTINCVNKTQTDLNMDGIVDEKDLNIFYDGLANRTGD